MEEEKRGRGRPVKGVSQATFTLDEAVVTYLNSLPSGQKSEFVNEAIKREIERRATCSLCDNPADVECKIGKCSPSTWYCSYHYMKVHDPEEGDEVENARIQN